MAKTARKRVMTDEQYWRVLDQVVRLEVVRGHLRWSIAELARGSGVGRTLIYYYFGNSKSRILSVALKMIGDEFFGLSPERIGLWERGEVRESILRTRALLAKAPHVTEFFFHWRHRESETRTELLALERRYVQKIRRIRPEWSATQAQALYAVFFGLAVCPDLHEDVIDQVLGRAFDGNRKEVSKASAAKI